MERSSLVKKKCRDKDFIAEDKKTFTLANNLLSFLRRNDFSAISTSRSNKNPQAAMTELNQMR